jgi:hypothetical protein
LVEEAVGKVETVLAVHDEPLPDSGNIIGFLQILLKTELECSQLNGEDEAEEVIRNLAFLRVQMWIYAIILKLTILCD